MNTNQPITHIVFDFGGVLLDWNPRYMYKHIFEDPEEMEYFLENITTYPWNLQQDKGRPFAEAIEELVKIHPQYTAQIQAYFDRWIEMISGEVAGVSDVLLALDKTGYPLYGLTNWSAETLPLVQAEYDFFKVFKGIVVSGEEKVIKPDPKIYEILLERYALPPTTTLFIDDNLENIKAAQAFGIQTIHFQSITQLKQNLKDYEIKL